MQACKLSNNLDINYFPRFTTFPLFCNIRDISSICDERKTVLSVFPVLCFLSVCFLFCVFPVSSLAMHVQCSSSCSSQYLIVNSHKPPLASQVWKSITVTVLVKLIESHSQQHWQRGHHCDHLSNILCTLRPKF